MHKTFLMLPVGLAVVFQTDSAHSASLSASIAALQIPGIVQAKRGKSGTVTSSFTAPDQLDIFARASDTLAVASKSISDSNYPTFAISHAVSSLQYMIDGGQDDVPLEFKFSLTGNVTATKNFSSFASTSSAWVSYSVSHSGNITVGDRSGINCYTYCIPWGSFSTGTYATVAVKLTGSLGGFDLEDLPGLEDQEFFDGIGVEFAVPDLTFYEERMSVLEGNLLGYISGILPEIGLPGGLKFGVAFEPTFRFDAELETTSLSTKRSGSITTQLQTTSRATSDAFAGADFSSTLLLDRVVAPKGFAEAIVGMSVNFDSGYVMPVTIESDFGPAPVPLPSSALMLLAGLGMVGCLSIRNRGRQV